MIGKGKLTIRADEVIGTIDPNIYGQFIEHLGRCIYPGIWVGQHAGFQNEQGFRKDVVHALKGVKPPIVRWPGGCFADFYHWEDGVGPRNERPSRINLWWGGVETNQFGTDEFLQFCSLIGAEPYVCLNVGSGTPVEALSWLEYCNYDGDSAYARLRAGNGHPKPYNVRYWGIGNENWGCGGAFDPVNYGWEYKRFASYMKRFNPSIKLVACGHTSRDWNLSFMETLKDHVHLIDYLSIHYYFGNPELYGSDLNFTDEQYLNLLGDIQKLEHQLQQAIRVVDFFAEGRKEIGIAVDEWGVWHPQADLQDGLHQQNTLRDAILAATVLNLFNNYSKKVKMANIAQTVNVLQSLCITKDEHTLLTPTYHVFSMYQPHMRNLAVEAAISSPTIKTVETSKPTSSREKRTKPLCALDASASLSTDRKLLTITLVNQSLEMDLETEIQLAGNREMNNGQQSILSASDVRAHKGFEQPNNVYPHEETIEAEGQNLKYTAPRHSVNRFVLNLK